MSTIAWRDRMIPVPAFCAVTGRGASARGDKEERCHQETQEEKMVLSLLARALSDDEIAKILSASDGHIFQVKPSLFHKFGVNRDDDLVWEARKRGYLQ
ncbi:MAG: hypothetical protein FJZ96_08520 [Chloroflexi bacterium]|nr:hypothetical protein [Chloroflexota bacterium]